MTMKLPLLTTHWDADDAQMVIAFLDELRDVLCTTYGEQIAENQRALKQVPLEKSCSFEPNKSVPDL